MFELLIRIDFLKTHYMSNKAQVTGVSWGCILMGDVRNQAADRRTT